MIFLFHRWDMLVPRRVSSYPHALNRNKKKSSKLDLFRVQTVWFPSLSPAYFKKIQEGDFFLQRTMNSRCDGD